ncbi:MAG TPA: hypothetical protein VHA56_12625 [Mucilaginibacter sp.]|nr:hypothetical protein [Mucilaginibacter sp.]
MIYTLVLLLFCINSNGQTKGGDILLSVDPPYAEDNAIYQPVNYSAKEKTGIRVRLSCYQYGDDDSSCIYDLEYNDVHIRHGIHSINLNLDRNDKLWAINYPFIDVVKKFRIFPPGNYAMYVTISDKEGLKLSSSEFYYNIDSTISGRSSIGRKLNKLLIGRNNRLPVNLKITQGVSQQSPKQAAFNTERLSRKLSRTEGVSSVNVTRDGEQYLANYYKGIFLGYYHIEDRRTAISKVYKEGNVFADPFNHPFAGTPEEGVSLDSKAKAENITNRSSDDMSGSIDVLGSFSNGQESTSQLKNNYGELRGDLRTKLLNIPLAVEGFYTTQDMGRKAKASYLRLKYDLDKAKDDLTQSTNAYQSRFNQVSGEIKNSDQLYARLVNQLRNEQFSIRKKFAEEYGVDGNLLDSYKGKAEGIESSVNKTSIVSKDISHVPNDSDVVAAKNKISRNKEKITKEYERITALQRKIEKYERLATQIKQLHYFDSVNTYSKLQELKDNPNVSYKQLVAASGHILPTSKVKSFMSGLTKLELGMLNKYESKYTLAGQNLKGGALGYDIGFAEVGIALGKTEYISRTGDVDRYNSYLARVDFKPIKKQHLGIIYYGYSPTHQIIESDNFIKADVGVPSFMKPVHVVSVVYSGNIAKQLSLETEAATSIKNSQKVTDIQYAKSSLRAGLVYSLPVIHSTVKAEWEHMGKEFENNSMPYTGAGTDRYTLSTQGSFLKSFLIAGVQFNYLKQESLVTTGYNVRWGIDIRTNSKQYPTVYLSYKPFSTFRRYDDTLAIPQRPITGAVSIVRGSYQWKRQNNMMHRLMVTYNQNSSDMDTIAYKAQTAQASYYLFSRDLSISATLGWMRQPSLIMGQSQATYFLTSNVSKSLNTGVRVNAGVDFAIGREHIQRLGGLAGIDWRLKNKPIVLHTQVRYSYLYQVNIEGMGNILAMQLGFSWLIKDHQ